MKHFKLPLIVTGAALVVALTVGIVLAVSFGSGAGAARRAEMLGQGLAIAVLIVIFPFWILAASKFGKERREAMSNPKPAGARKPGRGKSPTGRPRQHE